MADITITPASVLNYQGGRLRRNLTAGETITAGQPLYRLRSNNRVYKAAANGTEATAQCIGIAASGANAGQPIDAWVGGDISIGGTTVIGTVYCVSSNAAGGIMPLADLDSNDYVSILGVGKAGDVLGINIYNSTAQVP